jgi:hypothetical protein
MHGDAFEPQSDGAGEDVDDVLVRALFDGLDEMSRVIAATKDVLQNG